VTLLVWQNEEHPEDSWSIFISWNGCPIKEMKVSYAKTERKRKNEKKQKHNLFSFTSDLYV